MFCFLSLDPTKAEEKLLMSNTLAKPSSGLLHILSQLEVKVKTKK